MKRVSTRKLRRSAQAAQSAARARLRKPRPLGVSLARFTSAVAVAGALFASATHADAANRYWDQNLTGSILGGGSNAWDLTSAYWYDLTSDVVWNNANFDTAVFGNGGGTVTITGSPIIAGGLTFTSDGYEIYSGTLTLTPPSGVNSPLINTVGFGTRATISSILAGTSGLTKIGAGTLVLNNLANTLSGDVAIKDGSVVITDQVQLGAGTTAISITGIPNTGNPGYSGGSLVLAGTAGAGPLTLTREISVSGRGPGAANSAGGLISVGYNLINGGLTMGAGTGEGRASAAFGNTTITGGLTLGIGGAAIFSGNGNWIVSGQVTGSEGTTDRFIKTQTALTTTLWLQNATNNFTDSVRFDAGTVRVSTNAALGGNRGTQALDFNGGTLEIRSDAPDFSGRNVNFRAVTGNIFVDRAIGGSGLNQTFAFGNLNNSAQSGTMQVQGRDGNNVSFTAPISTGAVTGVPAGIPAMTWPTGGNVAYTNASNGTMTLNMSVYKPSDGSNARTLTVTATGETLLTGNYLQGPATGAANFAKSGVGVFTVQGTASTATGTTTINQGTLAIPNVASIPSGALLLGNATTTAGTLNYSGGTATLSNPITLNTTTANAYLNANGSGPLTVSGAITNALAGAHTLVLGGTNSGDNTVNSVIPINTTASQITSLQKIGTGTWVLAPSASNTFTGSTTVSGGTLKLTDGAAIDLLPDAGAVIFNADTFSQAAGGTLVYTGGANSETVGALTATAGHGNVTAASGTLTFASLGARTAGATINVSNSGTVNVTGTTGFLNAGTYFNGADFAYSGAGTTLRAPVYGTDAGFVNAAAGAATLTAASHNSINGAITAQTTLAVNSLKFNAANNLTLAGGATLTVGTGALGAGIVQTGGSSVISGGTALAASAAGNDFAIRVDNGANTLTINTPLTVSTAGLTKSGAGKLVLGGANTYSGTVNVNEGTLQMATGGLLGATNIGLNIRQGATFDLNGINVGTVASGTNSVNALNGAGSIVNSGAAAVLRVGNNNSSGLFTGPIGSGINLVKNGTGTLSLTNMANTPDVVTISAGAVAFALPAGTTTWNAGAGSPVGLGATAAGLVFNGGTLQYTGSGSIFAETQTPTITTDRQFTLLTNGTIDSSGRFGNNVLASGGANSAAMVWTNTNNLTFGAVGAHTLSVTGDSTGDNELRAHLVDSGAGTNTTAFTKAGVGLWILNPSSSNTHAGATTITGGALQVAPQTAAIQGLSANSNLVLNGGVLQTSGAFAMPLGTGAGQVQIPGSGGFAASTSKLTVNLGSLATLTLGAAPTATSTLIFNSTTALADVELLNPIDLNGAARTIQVDDNTSTGLDFATVPGTISNSSTNAATFTKTGAGTLILGSANTYNSNTILNNGSLVVTSIGATGDTQTSIGTNVSGGALQMGATTNTPNLLYVGPGETTSRLISFVGTTGTNTIDSSGSGPLVLANVANNATGAFTFQVRGSNTDGNMITSAITNGGTNVTTFTKSDGGVWILNPGAANSFTGQINASGGMLGLTANGIGTAAGITITNGGIFAYGGPLVTAKPLTLGNNASHVFGGSNSITFNSNVTKASGANDVAAFSNNLEGGAILTINGNFTTTENTSRTINIRGTGSTVWNGIIANGTGTSSVTNWNIAIDPGASFTMSGAANTYTGATTLSEGTLILQKKLTSGAGALNFNGGVIQATLPLTGADVLQNAMVLGGDPAIFAGSQNIEVSGLTTNSAGNRNLVNNITGGSTLLLSGGVSLSNDATGRTLTVRGSGQTTIGSVVANGGAGAGGLAYSGLYAGPGAGLTLTSANTATGALTVNRNETALSGAGAWAGTVTLNPTATLTLDNSAGTVNRLADANALTGQGGILNFIGLSAGGSAETTGALTLNSVQTYINMNTPASGSNALTFASVAFQANTGASLNLNGVPSLGTTNQVFFTTAPTLTGNIAPRIYVANGADFATYSGGTGVGVFSAYNISNNLNAAAAADTMDLTASAATTSHRTVNAIKLNGTGLSLSGAASNRLTLGAAAILNTAGNNSLDINEVALGANTGFVQVQNGTTLTVNSSITGTAGLAKSLPGTLILADRNFYTQQTNLLNGTTQLTGGLNTLFPNQNLNLNDGATLDVVGSAQYVGGLVDPGTMPGAGGIITSSSGTGTFVTATNATSLFSGEFMGNLNVGRVGGNTLTMNSAQMHTGGTYLLGGGNTLESDGTILSSSMIDVNAATLTLSNNTGLQYQNNDRIGDSIPITLRDGTFSITGRVSTAATETLGAVTSAQGSNVITANTGGGTISSLDLTLASLTRNAGTTVNFTGTTLGQQGNSARIMVTSPLSTVAGGALGAWAIANTTDYAAYNTGLGIGVVGTGGFAGYDPTFASGNITEIPGAQNATTTTLLSGGATTALLKLGNGSFNNITFGSGSDVLNLQQGGLLRANINFGASIGTAAARGVITSGTGELVVFDNGSANPTFANAATTLGSPIVTGINTVGLLPGMTVTNANFPAGTKVVSIDNSGQVTLSNNATATASTQTLTTGSLDGGSTTLGSPVITMASTVGVSPGMTLTGTGIPTGSYVVSVDSPTQLTLSQTATANAAGTITFTAGLSNVVINSVIQGGTSLVKSGAGVLTLTANNTYTGGTSVIQGTLNLAGSGVVVPAGGLVLGGANVTMLTNAGQIAASNAVTLRRSSTLTLVGNNTLDSLLFENNGGTTNPTVNVGGVLTLSNSTPVSVPTNMNAFTVPTVTGGTLALGAGAKTISVAGPSLDGATLYSGINPALSIASIITGTGPITKSGTGILQLSGQNTFSGLTVSGGGVVVGASSTPNQGGAGLTSGPLGAGAVSMAAGTTIFANTSASIGNAIAFAGTPLFDATDNTARTLTLNGTLTGLANGASTVNVTNPGLTVALLGNIPNIASITSFNKVGLGTLIFNATGYTGNFDATALGNASAVSLLHDGTGVNIGNGVVENIVLPGSVNFDAGITGTITVGRAGGTLPFNQAVNKTIQAASISTVLTNGLTVANNNGYGLRVSDSGALAGTPTFTVNTASNSNVTQGLYLSGDLSGTGFNKAGAGTLVIDNPTPANNTFTGTINIQNGGVSVSSDAQLGNAGNLVALNPGTATTGLTSTFRATGSFILNHTIQLSNATANTRNIEVTNGSTLTIANALDVSLAAGASLNKGDLGTLVSNANNPTWSGGVNITEGALLINNPALTTPFGTGTISVSPAAAVLGAAVQLAGGVSLNTPISLQGNNNVALGGINSQGQLQSLSGSNTYTGAMAVNFDAAVGASAGSQLTLGSAITVGNQTTGRQLNLMAFGDIIIGTGTTVTGNTFGISKYGSGTLDIQVPVGTTTGTNGIQLRNGLTILSGTGKTNTSGAANIVYGGATLRLDNSGTNTANRLNARAVTLQGGTFDFVSNNSTETAGAFVSDQGANTVNVGGSGTAALTFSTFTGNSGSSLNVTGTFGTATNFLKFTTAPALTPVTTGILNRVTTNGNELASYSATLGVVPFTGYAPATNILSATATQTFKATTATLNSLTGNQTLNALTLNNTAAVGGLGGNPPAALTLTSGTILANGSGGAFLNVPIVTLGGEGIIHVASGQTLTVNSGMNGSSGLSKDLAGELDINGQQFVSGTHYINGGTLKLTSTGITNPLLFNQALAVNAGGTFDLNGNNQFIAGLSSASAGGSAGIAGGTVTNSAAGQSTFTVNGNTNFAGVISGNIFLNKTNTGALNLQNAQTYTGPTLITGGTMTLADGAALPNTSQPIDINFGTLSLANGNLFDLGNRVSDTAPITLKGGVLTIAGRQQYASSETVGAITLADGHNQFTTSAGGTNVNSLDVTAASLTRTGATATVRFSATGQLGSSARLVFTTAPTLTNNIIGPWAIVDREFASYDSTYGIGALNGAGYAGYSGVGLNTGPTGTDNVRLTAAGTTLLAGNTTVGTLTFGQQAAATTLDLGGNTLTIQGGGLLFGQGTDSVNFAVTNGSLTGPSGGGDLYITHANFSGTNRTASIDAAITDNGGPVRVIKTSGDTGVSVMTWNGTNNYTGGTVLNTGTLVLGAASTLGTGGLTVNQGTLTQTAGAVIPAQAVTMGGGSTITLAGSNSFTGLTINNMGGGAPTLTPTGVLTLTGGTTVSSMNAGAVATIGTGTVDLNGAGSYAMNIGATVVNGVDVAPWQAGLSITSVIQNGGISKSGAGLLQLGGQSTFTGGINVTAGGLIIGASSTPSGLGDTVITGPLGTGAVTMAANTTLVSTAANTVANNFTFLGDTVFNGTNSLTLNGDTTLPSVWNATVTAPQMTVTIGNVVGSLSSDVTNKSGLGTLTLGNYNGTINIAGGLIFLADGNTLSTPENLSLGGNVSLTADTAITVNRSGAAPNARNKTLQKVNLTNNGSILAVNNQSGYGLEFTGTTTLTGASHFSVGVASASNVAQGLTLSGVVSDTGGFDLVKSGLGTLALTNSGNTFGGGGKTIDVLNGVLSASSDGALGNAANSVTLEVDGTTGTGFRATGSFSTGRTFLLNAANNAFEVTGGNTLTLTVPFSLGALANTLTKNDNGVLEINAANATWTGTIGINAGAILIDTNTAIGSGALTITNAIGSALQLGSAVNYGGAITLATNGASGLDTRGAIEATSGTATVSGPITQPSGNAVTLGAAAGATLNINGGISTTNSTTFTAGAGGIVNLNSLVGPGVSTSALNKIGPGTLNVVVNQTSLIEPININAGTFNVSGSGVTAGTAGLITVNPGAALTVSDATGAASAHLGGRALTLTGGTFTYTGNVANSAETFGALTINRPGNTISSNQTGAGTVALTFPSLTFGSDTAVNFTGTNLGTATNKILITTAPTLVPATGGILNRATVGGSTFATYGANGIAPFTAYNATSTTNINSAAATDTVDANAAMTTKNITASKTINALRLSGATAQTVSGNALTTLTLTAGGVLATGGGSHAITVPVLTPGISSGTTNVQEVFHVDSGTSLNISSVITGNAGWVKAGTGTLTLTPPSSPIMNRTANAITGNATLTAGTVILNGGNNTLVANQNLLVGPGATLDLNGNSQFVQILFTDTGAVEGAGGTITGGALAGSTLVINQDNAARNWAGNLTGALSFARGGQNTLSVYSNNDYTGSTLISGGTTTLRDGGRISGTSDIEIVYAALNLDNATSTRNLTDRLTDAAAISLRGGTLAFLGRAQMASTETVGAVTLNKGMSTITSTNGGTGVNSSELTLTSLDQNASAGATVLFSSNLGLIGSSNRILINSLSGNASVNTTVGAGLTNNIIGGWAITGNNEFATYIPGLGVASLNQTGALQYERTNTFIGSMPTDNVRLTSTTSIPNGGATVNAVTMTGAAINLNFATGTDTLNIASGGLIGPNNNQTIGATLDSGRLTAGGLTPAATSDLFIYNRANTLTLNSRIIDNPNGGTSAVRAIFTAAGGTITLVNPNNSYTGGTILNQGTLNLSNTASSVVIPAGGLTINGGTVTMNNFAGQIDPSNVVTLNGNAVLNLLGSNTLAGLVFRDDGGGTGGTGVNSNSGTLTLNGNVVSTTANPSSTSVLNGRYDFGATQRTFDIGATRFNGQELAALLSDFNVQGITGSTGGLLKVGDGVLQFNAPDVYTGPTQVDAGRLQLGIANGGSRFSAYNLNGVNTGINLNGLSSILGSLEGSGYVVNSSTTAGTLTVGFNGGSTTFSGKFVRFNDVATNTVNLAKIGAGTLTFDASGAASTTTGSMTVSRGAVTFKDAGTSSFKSAAVVVNEGATLNLDNSTATSTANVANRLAGGALTLNGGTLNFLGRDSVASTETAGVLTLGPSASLINLTPGTGGTETLTFASLTQSAGSTAIVSGTGLGTTSKLIFTTAPTLVPATTGILSRIAVGSDFATYAAGTGVTAFSGYTTVANVNAAAGTATIKVDGTTAIRNIDAARTINAVNVIDNNVTIGSTGLLLPTQGWTITSGGVLVNGNSAALSTPVLAFAGTEGIFRVNGSSLNVTGSITGTAGIAKTGTGNMTLSAPQSYTGLTALNLGNLTLAGGNNTLLVAPSGTIPTVADLQVNGGVLDLNGTNQAVRTLLDSNTLAFVAGEITNSSATPVTLTTAMTASSTFGGKLSGNFGVTRSGNTTLTLVDTQTYTGPTIIRGGGLTLQDTASLATSSITLNYGALTLNNNNLNALGALNPVRIAASTPVTLLGGTVVFTPGGSVDNSTTINSVAILAGGANTITPNGVNGGTNTITIGNLTMAANSGTTLHFSTDPGQPTSGGAQVFLTQLNGATPANNSFLGANVILNSGEYGVYNTIQGVIRLGGTAVTGNTVKAYDAALASGNNLPTNISGTGADVTLAANTTIGALRLTGAATRQILFTSGTEVLNLALGGLLRDNNNNAANIGTSALRGVLTSGGAATTGTTDLVEWHNQNTMTINAVIADNGLGNKTRLVKSGPAGTTLTAANTYTGGTVVDQGTLTINATAGAGTIVIPGDITLNNGNLTESTNSGQIAASSSVTINGAGTLTRVGTNTMNSITFNSIGGSSTPTVAVGTALTLSSATPITSTNDNYSFTPTISGTLLTLQDGASIATSGLSPDDLIISAPISTVAATTPLVKTGAGSLVLSSAASAFANGFNLNQGSLIFANSSAGTPPAVTAGPIGTGTLSLANGVAIMSEGTARTIGNAVSVAQDFTFGTPAAASSRANAGNSLTLSGTTTLAAGAHNIEVGGLLMTGTISGKLTGGTNLSKSGPGTLVLSNATNDYGGATTVNAGTLQIGTAGSIPDGSALTVASGGFFNINGLAETVGSLAGAGVITNTGAAATLTTGADNTDTTFSGTIANQTSALNLAKLGTGKQTLSSANTYTGTTSVTGGILSITDGAALGATTSGTSVTNATLQLSNNITVGAEALTLNGGAAAGQTGALVNVSGTNTYGGAINVATSSSISALPGSTLNLTTIAKSGTTATLTGGGTINVSGAITGAAAGSDLVVDGGTTAVLSGASTFTGPTTVTGASSTLEISGSLSGATTVSVNSGGSLLLSNNASNIVNNTAALSVDGGSVHLGSSVDGKEQHYSSLTLSNTSTLDFGTGATGNTISFSMAGTFSGTLNIWNWSAGSYLPGGPDTGALGDNRDRLVFDVATGWSAGQFATINFFSDAGMNQIGTGAGEIAFGGSQFEIVPVPEPSSTALLGAIGLVGLVGYRERRRFSAVLNRKGSRQA